MYWSIAGLLGLGVAAPATPGKCKHRDGSGHPDDVPDRCSHRLVTLAAPDASPTVASRRGPECAASGGARRRSCVRPRRVLRSRAAAAGRSRLGGCSHSERCSVGGRHENGHGRGQPLWLLLSGFALLTLLSALWSTNDAEAFSEFNRVSFYLGVFVLVLQLAPRVPLHRLGDGLALGIAAVVAVALFSRIAPGVLPGSRARRGAPRDRSTPELPDRVLERPCDPCRARRATSAAGIRLAGTSISASACCGASTGRCRDHLPRVLTRGSGNRGDRRRGLPCAQPIPLEGRWRCCRCRGRISARAGRARLAIGVREPTGGGDPRRREPRIALVLLVGCLVAFALHAGFATFLDRHPRRPAGSGSRSPPRL